METAETVIRLVEVCWTGREAAGEATLASRQPRAVYVSCSRCGFSWRALVQAHPFARPGAAIPMGTALLVRCPVCGCEGSVDPAGLPSLPHC